MDKETITLVICYGIGEIPGLESGASRLVGEPGVAHHYVMESSHGFRNFVLGVVALVAVGVVAWWLLGALIHVLFYVIVGALAVGGAVFVYGRARRAISGGNNRRIGR